MTVSISGAGPSGLQITYGSVRGFFYKLQSTPDLRTPFTDAFGGFAQALDSPLFHTDNATNGSEFYRVVRTSTP